ncbi:hypothetical protein GCM10009817_39710 [Terrabacter lapilli]|uniref:Uncharacterized protein n=1 Tax=Terrabacter lapilli TaxID=436231 RepID=A0ABN2SVT7_9MICO
MAGCPATMGASLTTSRSEGEWVSVREGFPPEISMKEALEVLSRPRPPRFQVPAGTPRIIL